MATYTYKNGTIINDETGAVELHLALSEPAARAFTFLLEDRDVYRETGTRLAYILNECNKKLEQYRGDREQ